MRNDGDLDWDGGSEMECQIDDMYFVDRRDRMADGVDVRMSRKEE